MHGAATRKGRKEEKKEERDNAEDTERRGERGTRLKKAVSSRRTPRETELERMRLKSVVEFCTLLSK